MSLLSPPSQKPLNSSASAVVFLIHGTRNVTAGEHIVSALESLCPRFAETTHLPPEAVRFSFLEIMQPSLATVLTDLCHGGKTHIRILPLLLFPGTHFYQDIPEIAQAVMQNYPNVTIDMGDVIGVEDPEFMSILLKRLAVVV